MDNNIPCEICDTQIPFPLYITHLETCRHLYQQTVDNYPPILGLFSGVLTPNSRRASDSRIANPFGIIGMSSNGDLRPRQGLQITATLGRNGESLDVSTSTQDFLSHTLTELFHSLRLFPSESDDDYDRNISLQNLMGGNVVVGINDIDMVSDIVEFSEDIANVTCTICQNVLSDVNTEDDSIMFRKLICNHVFCDECIQTWLETSKKCPNCHVDLEVLCESSSNVNI